MLGRKGLTGEQVKPSAWKFRARNRSGRGSVGRRPAFLWAWFGAWLLVLVGVPAEEAPPSEPQVKAAFLFNFAKYVDWPRGAFATPDSPIVLGVVGRDEMGDALAKTISGKTVDGRRFELKRFTAGDNCAGCHILFLSASEKKRLPEILARLRGASVLTVGESESFLQAGGVINFARRNQRVRLEVNAAAADQAGLKISSKLLNVADLVIGGAKKQDPP